MKKGDTVLIEIKGPRGGKRKPQMFKIIAVADIKNTVRRVRRKRSVTPPR